MRENERKYMAIYSIGPGVGYGIVDIQFGIDDYCVVDEILPNKIKRTKNKIYMSTEGKNYIRKRGQRLYLDDFLATRNM